MFSIFYIFIYFTIHKTETQPLHIKIQCNKIYFYFSFYLKFWKMLTFKMFVINKKLLLTAGYYLSFPSLNRSSWSGIYLNHPSHSGLCLLSIVMIFLRDDRGDSKSKEVYCSNLFPWHSQRPFLRDLDDSVCLGKLTFSWWQSPFESVSVQNVETRKYIIQNWQIQYFFFVLWSFFPQGDIK